MTFAEAIILTVIARDEMKHWCEELGISASADSTPVALKIPNQEQFEELCTALGIGWRHHYIHSENDISYDWIVAHYKGINIECRVMEDQNDTSGKND